MDTPELISDDPRRNLWTRLSVRDVRGMYEYYVASLKAEFPHAQPLPFPQWLSLHTTLQAVAGEK